MKISEHFTLEEFSFSQVADRLGLDNTPGSLAIANLGLVVAVMERGRTLLGNKPILVYSGYRSPPVNKAVGGAANSVHCFGLACDFVCPEFGAPYEVALEILNSDIEYDQLILEYGWVHIGLARPGSRLRQETMTKRSPLSPYEVGIRT